MKIQMGQRKPQQIEVMQGRVYPSDINFSDLELKLTEICILPVVDYWNKQRTEVLKSAEETAVLLGFDYYFLQMNKTGISVGVQSSKRDLFAYDYDGSLYVGSPSPRCITSRHKIVEDVKPESKVFIGIMHYYTKKK